MHELRLTGGRFKGRWIDAPQVPSTRPTSEKLRKTYFDILQDRLVEADSLDLFAGSGALGLEAISRGASHCTFVENHPIAVATIKKNGEKLGISQHIRIIKKDIFKALSLLNEENRLFNLVFIDPPYTKEHDQINLSANVLLKLDTGSILKNEAILFLEESRFFNFEKLEKTLNHLKLISRRAAGDSFLFEFIFLDKI